MGAVGMGSGDSATVARRRGMRLERGGRDRVRSVRAAFKPGGVPPALETIAFQVAAAAIAESQSDADTHETERREEQHEHAAADGSLAILGGAAGVGVAHCTALTEGG